jgi:hypothetical protein
MNDGDKTINIDGYECKKLDEWKDGTATFVLGQDVNTENGTFYYAQVSESDEQYAGQYNYEYDSLPDRKTVQNSHIDKLSEIDIDNHEAEFGADGSHVFPHLNDDPVSKASIFQKINNQYKRVYIFDPQKYGIKATGKECLESILHLFNDHQPADYRGKSLGVSDVIGITENGVDKYFCCDTSGLRAAPDFTYNESDIKIGLEAKGLSIDGMSGTWSVIDKMQVDGEDFYLAESEQYGDQAENVVIDTQGKLIGFADNPELTDRMKAAAAETKQNDYNPLKNAEMLEESDYDMLDGIPNNGFGKDENKPHYENSEQPAATMKFEEKPSVIQKLHDYQEIIANRDITMPLDQDRDTSKTPEAEL